MTKFAQLVATKVADYVQLRRSLGYAFKTQAATLEAFRAFVRTGRHSGPLTEDLAMAFVLSRDVTPNVRARRHGVLLRFAEYLAIFDPRTATLDPRALPRSRAIPPARILDQVELARLLQAARSLSPDQPLRGRTLHTIVGLLSCTGLRSGEALRLDRADVDLASGVLQVRKSKFRKDRVVPIHPTARVALTAYATARDVAFPDPKSPAFFVSLRGGRLSSSALGTAFSEARARAGLLESVHRALRPHDLRHRFATTRLVEWHREGVDVQARLPLLATYLGHVRYSDTAYYVTGTAELLGLAAGRAFARSRGRS